MSIESDLLAKGRQILSSTGALRNAGSFDPRSNTASCLADRLMAGQPTQTTGFGGLIRKAAGNALGQAAFNYVTGSIPKIQVDNNVNAGVRLLVDSVNTSARSFAGKSVNEVSQTVFAAAGINSSIVPSDPNGQTIYGNAQTAAGVISSALIAGAVDELSLPGPISGLASLAFLQQEQSSGIIDISDPGCQVTPYARDLIEYAPKHNFMFMVIIEFQPDYLDLGMQTNPTETTDPIKFHYLCNQFTRPSIDIEYEDVNMYNFHTKVAKKITYEPVQLKLYDDVKNSSMVFLEKYLKVRSPIAKRSKEEAGTYETRGMDFTPRNSGETGSLVNELPGSSASMGGLLGENKTVLSSVEVFHIFNYGARVNKYSFLNPKLTQLNMSDFDMTGAGEPTSIDLTMSYDSMFLETDVDVGTAELRDNSRLGQREILSYSKE